MRLKRLRWGAAALVAFLLGVPFVSEARADDWGRIVRGVFQMVFGIVDVAGDS